MDLTHVSNDFVCVCVSVNEREREWEQAESGATELINELRAGLLWIFFCFILINNRNPYVVVSMAMATNKSTYDKRENTFYLLWNCQRTSAE